MNDTKYQMKGKTNEPKEHTVYMILIGYAIKPVSYLSYAF